MTGFPGILWETIAVICASVLKNNNKAYNFPQITKLIRWQRWESQMHRLLGIPLRLCICLSWTAFIAAERECPDGERLFSKAFESLGLLTS